MKIAELSRRSGLTPHTIRYYEKIGLLPYADRDAAGHRSYDDAILGWIAFLGHLKSTDMPIRDMLRYAELRRQGDSTGAARQAMLVAHRAEVRRRVAALSDCLSVLDMKIESYDQPREQIHDQDPHIRDRSRNPV